MLAINNEKNNIDLTYMPERPTDVQRRRKSSDASYESTTPSSPPSSTPPSPPSYDLFVSHNLREIKQPKQSQKIYESNKTIFDYKLSYIFKEHSDVLEELLSSDPALTNMIYDMINISNTNTNKIDLGPKKDEPKKDEPKEEEPKKDEPKKDEPKKDEPKEEEPKKDEPKEEDEYTNNNEITYDDIYNNDEIYVEEYKRRCLIS